MVLGIWAKGLVASRQVHMFGTTMNPEFHRKSGKCRKSQFVFNFSTILEKEKEKKTVPFFYIWVLFPGGQLPQEIFFPQGHSHVLDPTHGQLTRAMLVAVFTLVRLLEMVSNCRNESTGTTLWICAARVIISSARLLHAKMVQVVWDIKALLRYFKNQLFCLYGIYL